MGYTDYDVVCRNCHEERNEDGDCSNPNCCNYTPTCDECDHSLIGDGTCMNEDCKDHLDIPVQTATDQNCIQRIHRLLNRAGVPNVGQADKRLAYLVEAFVNLVNTSYGEAPYAEDPSWCFVIESVERQWEKEKP